MTRNQQYNLTQLHPYKYMEKNVVHRDLIAHVQRWSYALRLVETHWNILDFGCGDAGLYETFYRNRFSPNYLGLDIRRRTIEKNRQKFPKAGFEVVDLATSDPDDWNFGTSWNLICSFEVLEHVNRNRVNYFLENIQRHCNLDTIVLLSTPNYDERVGAADNHVYAGEIHEWNHQELQVEIEKYFTVEDKIGTFISQRDLIPRLNPSQLEILNQLKKYHNINFISNMFAPLFPEQARNCLWRLRLKK